MMKEVVLQWDTTTSATLSNSITANANNLWIEVNPENISEFKSADDTIYVSTVGRYYINASISLINFEDDNSIYVDVNKFLSAPVKRIKYITSTEYPDINGYDEFNSDNEINLNVNSSETNWSSNKKYRNVTITLMSQQKYNI